MPSELSQYRDNVYSQYGEDGVIREICRRLDVDSGWFCEFGAWDGKHLSNTYRLLDEESGWSGVMIEGHEEKFPDLQQTAAEHPDQLTVLNEYVSHREKSKTIDRLLATTDAPVELECVSIDVDGEDYFIWESMTEYRPLVVLIEVSGEVPPPLKQISEVRTRGTSFSSMVALGQRKGYTPVCHTPANLIFVRNDAADCLDLPSVELEHPEVLYNPHFYEPELPDGQQSNHVGGGSLLGSGIRLLLTEGPVTTANRAVAWASNRGDSGPQISGAWDRDRMINHLTQSYEDFKEQRVELLR